VGYVNTWLQDDHYTYTPQEVKQNCAILAWKRIEQDPTTVNFRNSTGTKIGDQIVRIESDNRASFAESVAGTTPTRKLIIFGVRDHPTQPDTIMKDGYYFNLSADPSDRFTIIDIIDTVDGELQAIAEATR
jgi:hypothetical protein